MWLIELGTSFRGFLRNAFNELIFVGLRSEIPADSLMKRNCWSSWKVFWDSFRLFGILWVYLEFPSSPRVNIDHDWSKCLNTLSFSLSLSLSLSLFLSCSTSFLPCIHSPFHSSFFGVCVSVCLFVLVLCLSVCQFASAIGAEFPDLILDSPISQGDEAWWKNCDMSTRTRLTSQPPANPPHPYAAVPKRHAITSLESNNTLLLLKLLQITRSITIRVLPSLARTSPRASTC